MNKMYTIAQYAAALLCFIIAVATLVNLIFIVQRPETISVVNTMIGQGVLIIGFFALGRVMLKKAKSDTPEN